LFGWPDSSVIVNQTKKPMIVNANAVNFPDPAGKILVQKAWDLAEYGHLGQTDKAGKPYIFHIIRVYERLMKTCLRNSHEAIIAGILHDIVEDTPITLCDLSLMGFPDRSIKAICVLTKPKRMDYEFYIRQILDSGNTDALQIKVADLQDHLADTQHISDEQIERYWQALETINREE
jgi:(p)ppGpp synthase/HD superfamily hydrolase